MASIQPHVKGWRVQVNIKGQRDSRVFASKRDAQQWAAKRETELRNGEVVGSKTLAQAIHRYKLEVSSKKEGRIQEVIRLDNILDYFGDVPLHKINQPEIAKWRDERLKTIKGSTMLRERNLLRNLFNVSRKEWKWSSHEPCKDVAMPKEGDHRTALWDWKRIRRVLRQLDHVSGKKPETSKQQAALAFLIGLHTSLRASEILRVNPDSLNSVTRVIEVKTKTMKLARVPITRRAVKACKLANFTISAILLDEVFRKARDDAGVGDYTFHDSRGFALTMLARKVDVLTLSRISQHKTISMLSRYYRETPESIAGRM